MTLRPATRADAPAICAVWNAVIRDTTATFTTVEKTRSQIEALIAERGAAFVVAEQGKAIVGFATFGPFRTGPGYADVVEHSIYLTRSAQGSGLGRALMDRVSDIARSQGKHIIVACISGDNTDARAFHAKLGFEQVGFMPKIGQKFGRRHDLCWMQKNL